MSADDDQESLDRHYQEGQRAALQSVICSCLRDLGYDEKNPVAELARLVVQREGTLSALRRACAQFGDNDWPDELALEDAIEKHLARPMQRIADEALRYRYCKWVNPVGLVALAWNKSKRACAYEGGDVDRALDIAIEDTGFERRA